jgi:hypothetical protein
MTPSQSIIILQSSQDGESFEISSECAEYSAFIKKCLLNSDTFSQERRDTKKVIKIPNVTAKTLRIVCDYLMFKVQKGRESNDLIEKKRMKRMMSESSSDDDDDDDDEDDDDEFSIPQEEALNVLMASNFLDC